MNEDSSLEFSDFVNNAILQSSQDEVNSGDFVSLMTVHTAKGLEYDYVFIYTFSQGVFPSERSVSESKSGMEEERRLAYVAITRAKKKLYITSNQDYSFMLQGPLRPSVFIKEAGIGTYSSTYSFQSSFLQGKNPYFKPKGLQQKDVGPKASVFNASDSNGVTDWKVGDRAEHTKFGKGTVSSVIPSGNKQLIIIQFDNSEFGKKTFMGTHVSIKRA
jgi:DNA helicase-2/ATP-dependent DNA helicase PcrA